MPVPRPKDAASLILLRDRAAATEVLMGRRHADSRFLPGYHVFPGGIVDPDDGHAVPASMLNAAATDQMGVGGREARARAIAMAAVRETFEETGLLVCAPGDVGRRARGTWAELRARGLAPALDRLSYLGRAITPTNQPLRYHARFFAVEEDALSGHMQPDGELEDLLWIPAQSVSDLRVLRVTTYMLGRALLERREGRSPHKPLFSLRNNVAGIWLDDSWSPIVKPD